MCMVRPPTSATSVSAAITSPVGPILHRKFSITGITVESNARGAFFLICSVSDKLRAVMYIVVALIAERPT